MDARSACDLMGSAHRDSLDVSDGAGCGGAGAGGRASTQDFEPDPTTGQRRIRRGVAADRMPSLGDSEMRDGRKTRTKPFTGYKRHVLTLLDHDLIVDALVRPANEPEHVTLAPLAPTVAAHGPLAEPVASPVRPARSSRSRPVPRRCISGRRSASPAHSATPVPRPVAGPFRCTRRKPCCRPWPRRSGSPRAAPASANASASNTPSPASSRSKAPARATRVSARTPSTCGATVVNLQRLARMTAAA